LGEIRLGEMGLGEMGLGEMGQNPSTTLFARCADSPVTGTGQGLLMGVARGET